MKIDMHVHTSKYSACAVSDPDQIILAALEAGLDGIVLTEHNSMWNNDELDQLRKKYPELKIFNGVEVNVKGGSDILVYGVSSPSAFYKGIPIQELICNVREEGGMVAIAHPFRYKDYVPDEIFEYPIDGIEVMSCNIRAYMREKVDELWNSIGAIGISGSDAHHITSVGAFATDFNRNIADEKELVSALKSRDFSLFRNESKIEKMNKDMADKTVLARKLIEEGLTKEDIKKNYGIAFFITDGVKSGKDMRMI